MADIISRLRLESGEFDSKIKRAGQELMAYSEHCRKSGLVMGFANKDARDFAKSLGNMQTTSTTARGKISELSDAFVNLRMMYKQMTDEEKNNQFGKNLAASLDQLKTRIQDAKKDLSEVTSEMNGASSAGKGGFLSGIGGKMGGAMQVFGGNLLAEGVSKLTSELTGSVQQSIELARQGEGIRIAFERLGRGDILDGLREDTHGTVTDLGLMKAAVKFNDFKLPLDQLGTMLAFAQQKAKDTGESVDYMVESITNGLGRQSKPILDNLGISAKEIEERMKSTGDFTKAVGDIIRDQMAKAGDYVETAADRAQQATVAQQNKMEELGRSAMPVAEEFASAWAEIRNGAMTLVLPVLSSVADSIRDIREILGGEWDMPKLKPGIPNLAEGPAENNQPKRPTWGDVPVVKAPGGYVEVTDRSGKVLHGGHYDSDAQLQNMMKRWNTLPTRTPGSRSTAKQEQTELQQNQTRINDLTQQYVTLMAAASEAGKPLTDEQQKQTAEIQRQIAELEKRNGLLNLYQEQAQGRLMGVDVKTGGLSMTGGFTGFATPTSMSDVVRQRGDNLLDDNAMKAVNEDISRNLPKAKEKDSPMESGKKLLNGISQLTDGLEKIGIDIPDEIQSVISVIQGVMQVIETVNTIIGVTQTSALTANTIAMGELSVALWANTAASVIPFANGGIVPHAASGYFVGGRNYSGDVTPIMANAGELILNKAQQGNLASQLEGGAFENMKLDAVISGEQIRLVLNNNGRRTGRGEYVQSTRRR